MSVQTLELYLMQHGSRVRRCQAMEMLSIGNRETFRKVVDATPGLAHRLPGEGQDRYKTEIIYRLVNQSHHAACGRPGEEQQTTKQVSPAPKR